NQNNKITSILTKKFTNSGKLTISERTIYAYANNWLTEVKTQKNKNFGITRSVKFENVSRTVYVYNLGDPYYSSIWNEKYDTGANSWIVPLLSQKQIYTFTAFDEIET